MKKIEDIIIAMLDSLAYELIAAYRDFFPKNDTADFLDYIENIYNQVVSDQEEEEDREDGN